VTRILGNLCLSLLVAAAAVAQPTITSVSSTTSARSSRVLIQGSGFGSLQGAGHVEIGGISAPLTRWSDALIAAYVPETSPPGAVNVQVFDSQGFSSNLLPMKVTLRPPQSGRIRWRFQADGDYIQSRPAVGTDGTVYAIDVSGHLYALAPDGGLKWIFNATGYGFGNVDVGPDGTIYTGSATAIFALAPDRTLRWQYNQSPAAFILLGPNVGPDGNIYSVGMDHLGVFSLTPQGSLRWSVQENYARPIVDIQEIVFGSAALYFHADGHLRGVGLDGSQVFTNPESFDTSQGDPQPAVGPDGSIYINSFSAFGQGLALSAFDASGNFRWGVLNSPPTNRLSMPDVGKDGVIYDGRDLINLYAVNPDGTVRWQYTDSGTISSNIVSPLNDLIFLGGGFDYPNPGFFEAVSTTGKSLWKIILPDENGLKIGPLSRARFSRDGQTAYIGTMIPGQSRTNPHSYLYSVQTAGTTVFLSTLTLNPTSVKGGTSSHGTITLSGPAPAGGALVKVGSSNTTVARVPLTLTVPAGSTSATFTVMTKAVSVSTKVTISASYGVRKNAALTVIP
jgi:outer membrane protein assembly factor BamB